MRVQCWNCHLCCDRKDLQNQIQRKNAWIRCLEYIKVLMCLSWKCLHNICMYYLLVCSTNVRNFRHHKCEYLFFQPFLSADSYMALSRLKLLESFPSIKLLGSNLLWLIHVSKRLWREKGSYENYSKSSAALSQSNSMKSELFCLC